MLAVDFSPSHNFIEKILHSVGFSVKLGEWVPHDLTLSRTRKRVDATKEVLDPHNQEPFLHRLAICKTEAAVNA